MKKNLKSIITQSANLMTSDELNMMDARKTDKANRIACSKVK